MKKAIFLLLGLAIVCSCNNRNETSEKAPLRVKTTTLATLPAGTGHTFVGIIEEREATAVSFTSMGTVRRVAVSEGQTVGRGQLIAEMDATNARNILATAEAQMTQANDALTRYGMLHDSGSLPEVQWVEIQSKVAQAKSQLEIAKKNVADCRLTAPVSGIIGRKMVNAGETAMPSQAIVSILDISSVKVKVSVPEKEMAAIGPSTASFITVEAAGKQVSGGKIEKGVQADAMTHTYDIRISVPNADRKLLPGMVASVSLDIDGSASDAGTPAGGYIPLTCVQRMSNGKLFVWTVDKANTAHRKDVSVGQTQGNDIQIIGGLDHNERIVTEGYQKLSEGTKVIY